MLAEILGVQLVITCVVAYILAYRIGGALAPAQRLLWGLRIYKCPSMHQLLNHVNRYYISVGMKPLPMSSSDFPIPIASGLFRLEQLTLSRGFLPNFSYFSAYQAYIIVGVGSLLLNIFSVAYKSWRPESALARGEEADLSLLWMTLTALIACESLRQITGIYLRINPERWLVVIAFMLSFLIVAITMLISTERLDFNIEQSVTILNNSNVFTANGVRLKLGIIYGVLALIGGLTGAMLLFPSYRFARLHLTLMQRTNISAIVKFAHRLNMLLPAVLVLAWVRPLSRDMLAIYGVSDTLFEQTRLYVVILTCILRIILARSLVQVFLDTAAESTEKLFSSKRTNVVKASYFREKVLFIMNYTNLVCIQITAPAVLVVMCIFISRSLSELPWVPGIEITPLAVDTPWRPLLKCIVELSLWLNSVIWFFMTHIAYMYHDKISRSEEVTNIVNKKLSTKKLLKKKK